MPDHIRIFVGTPANNEDLECQCVLDYSIRKHASLPVEITWMMLSRNPASPWYADPQAGKGWNTKSWATPFTALRMGIPAACNFEGRAIYMDSDMIALADVAELWNQPIPPGKAALAAKDGATCVMLFDNARMKGVLPPLESWKGIESEFRKVRRMIPAVTASFDGDWNCRDGIGHASIRDPDVKLLHYTRIPTQPNHRHARERLKREGKPHWYPGPDVPHPNKEIIKLFDDTFAEAIAAGRGPETFRVAPEFGEYGRS